MIKQTEVHVYNIWEQKRLRNLHVMWRPHYNKLKDCIRNTTAVCNLRQNSVQDKFSPRQIQSKTKFSLKKQISDHQKKILRLNFVLDCILSQTEFVSDFQCTF